MNPEHNTDTDIVERLRSTPQCGDPQIDDLLNAALVEIERLRAKCALALALDRWATGNELEF